MIYLSSDLHIGHDKEFLYKPRGFDTVQEMNEFIVQKQNEIVSDDDDYYILGDVTLGKLDEALPYLRRLRGHIHVIRGNHDSNARMACYKELGWETADALFMPYKKKIMLFLSHFPMNTESHEVRPGCPPYFYRVINLHGHTHQTGKFDQGDFNYHVGCDSSGCTPLLLDDIVREVKEQVRKTWEVTSDGN